MSARPDHHAADIALVTEARYAGPSEIGIGSAGTYLANILLEDRLLSDALAGRGLSATRVAWEDEGVDWSAFRCALLRTPWNYFERLDAFVAWITRVDRETRLVNPAEMVRWNIDKHYLLELASHGIPVVPTRAIEAGERTELADVLDRAGWRSAVIKPAVSGAARETFRVQRNALEGVEQRFARLVASEAMLVQPFVESVLDRGETTLVFVDGEPTHAVRKRPKAGDFRVQDDHGGTVHDHVATARETELLRATLDACPETRPVYGRIDLVEDADGHPMVGELELVEPEMWFRFAPHAATRMAETLVRRMETAG